MKVTRLRLLNYRGARDLALDFEPDLNVLCGPNGAGKSTVLDGLAGMLSWCAARLRSANSSGTAIGEGDIRNSATFASLEVACRMGSPDAAELTWRRLQVRKGKAVPGDGNGLGPVGTHLTELGEWAARMRGRVTAESGEPSVPILVYYPVHRAVLDIPLRIRKKHEFEILETYDGAFSGGANFRDFFEWFRNREDLENERFRDSAQMKLFGRPGERFNEDSQLGAARRAISVFLPHVSAVSVRRSPLRMEASKRGERMTVDQMSDGEKCLIALVGDLARRLAIANPASEDPLLREGVVLIDEIDLHLHPAWQRMVIPRLRATFPGCQFIVSTHSPQVLGEVPAHCVRRLGNEPKRGLVATVPSQSFGLDSSAILEEEMGASSRDEGVAASLAEIFRFIDEEKFDEARRSIEALNRELDGSIPELVRAESLIAMLEPDGTARS